MGRASQGWNSLYFKKSLKENVVKDFTKEWLFDFTEKHPLVFKSFRDQQAQQVRSLPSDSIDPELNLNSVVDHLIAKLRSIKQGPSTASDYHKTIVGILECYLSKRLITCTRSRDKPGQKED